MTKSNASPHGHYLSMGPGDAETDRVESAMEIYDGNCSFCGERIDENCEHTSVTFDYEDMEVVAICGPCNYGETPEQFAAVMAEVAREEVDA